MCLWAKKHCKNTILYYVIRDFAPHMLIINNVKQNPSQIPTKYDMTLLNRQGCSSGLFAKGSAHLRHPLKSSLTSGYEAEHKPKQREHLSAGGYYCQDRALQPHGEVKSSKERHEVDRSKWQPVPRAEEVPHVVDGAPEKCEGEHGEDRSKGE